MPRVSEIPFMKTWITLLFNNIELCVLTWVFIKAIFFIEVSLNKPDLQQWPYVNVKLWCYKRFKETLLRNNDKNKELFSSVQHRYLAAVGWGWLPSKHICYRADLKKCSIYSIYSVVYIYLVLYHYRIRNVPKTVLSRVLDKQPLLQNKNKKKQKNCNHLSYLG